MLGAAYLKWRPHRSQPHLLSTHVAAMASNRRARRPPTNAFGRNETRLARTAILDTFGHEELSMDSIVATKAVLDGLIVSELSLKTGF
jgi:hypothetical protein